MKNRILSLVLAIVMVVLAVPAFVLPMTAANSKGFKTSFGFQQETWPLYTSEEFLGYGTPWEVGRFKVGQGATSYQKFGGFDAQFTILNLNGGDQWENCGVYLTNSRYILTGSGVATEVAEGAADSRNALVLNYVSPYEGYVDLGFDNITPVNAETVTCLDIYIAIFINGEMIWPVAGGDMGKAEDWAHLLSDAEPTNKTGESALAQFQKIKPDALKNVKVTRGDRIQFALSRGGSNYGYAEPTVTFADGYLVVPTTMTESFGYNSTEWPILGNGSGNRTFKQISERWTIGDIPAAGGEFAAYDHYFRKSTDSWACRTGEDYPGNSGKNPSNGAVMLTSSFAELRGGILLGNTKDYLPGFAYEAVATGTATASFADLKLIGTDKGGDYVVATSGTAQIKIFKNGTLVETVTATATADGVTATFPEMAVVRGDVIAIVVADATGIVGVAGVPTVAYKSVDSFMSEVVEDTYAIKLENGTALFGDTFGVTFYTYATKEVYNSYTEAGLYVWSGDIAAADRTADNATVVPATMNDSFAFVANYSDFVAKEMADDIAVQAFIKVNDGTATKTITSDVVENKSVADYIAEQYAETKDTDLKKVLVAMLNYGAYAQTYFNYNTDNLANATLAAEDKAMDKEVLYYASFDGVKGPSNNVCNSEIEAFALELNNTINLKVYIKIDEHEKFDDEGKLRTMQLQIADTADGLGAGTKVTINTDAGSYTDVVLVEDISLTEMSKTFYFRVTCRYGPTLYYGYNFSYSVESYAARMVDSTEPGLADLVRAMMEFGKAINAYNA